MFNLKNCKNEKSQQLYYHKCSECDKKGLRSIKNLTDYVDIGMTSIDKQKERLEKLARWKQKKSESKAVLNTQNVNTNSQSSNQNNVSDIENKLEKVKAWKKRKLEVKSDQQTPPATQSEINHTSSVRLEENIQGIKRKKRQKRVSNVFDEVKPINSTPTNDAQLSESDILEKVDLNTEDPLDSFFGNIETTEEFHFEVIDNKVNNDELLDEDNSKFDALQKEQKKLAKAKKNKNKKLLTPVNFRNIDLDPISKCLYNEPEEIKSYTEDEIADLRLDLDNIKIEGKDCPRPVTKWSQLGIPYDIIRFIKDVFSYKSLTPIQTQTIPAIMSGRDVIGISKTGSGKTISYLLPMIRHVKAQKKLRNGETGPIAVIFAPTRELAVQINEEVQKLISDLDISSICCTGGSDLKKQIDKLKTGVEIAIATPGRFIDLLSLNGGNLVSTLRISFVVMDEADRLFDFGFEPQIASVLRTVRPDRQCVLFSATFPSKVSNFASRFLDSPLQITVNAEGMVNERINQKFTICSDESDKFKELLSLLKVFNSETVDEKTIIFVSSQQICDIIEKRLTDYSEKLYSIHAGRPYNERRQNLELFKKTSNSILLCTEVMSRGLNVPEVSRVILYNSAKTFAQYVHSTGRTARGTRDGTSISLLLPNELSSAYILNKAMRDKDFSECPVKEVKNLKQMAQKFEDGLKSGKYKLSTGLGGKGLENMDNSKETSSNDLDEQLKHQDNISISQEADLPDDFKFDTSVETVTNADGTIATVCKFVVNDLPQLVRWEMTKNTSISNMIRETGCSITLRGRYYPPSNVTNDNNTEPKLYLLIEATDDKAVRHCVDLLKDNARVGFMKATSESLRNTKY